MKILNKKTMLALALATAAALQTAQAGLTPVYASLSTLANGGSLSIGDKTFSGFGYTPNLLTSFDASLITVTASVGTDGTYYLTWGGNISLNTIGTTANATADLLLTYTVAASAGTISMIDQSYTGSSQNGALAIDETVKNAAGAGVASSHLDLNSLNGNSVGPNLNVNGSYSTLYVTKDIGLATGAGGGFVTISQVSQSFHQTAVPEPSTVVAGALLLLPFGVSTLRILRKNKVS